MENASKALIIAGSILLSILIIALGMYIFSSSSGVTDDTTLSQMETNTFNGKFDKYKGRQNGSNVTALLETLLTNSSGKIQSNEVPLFRFYNTTKNTLDSTASYVTASFKEANVKTYKTAVKKAQTLIESSHVYFVYMATNTDSDLIHGIDIYYQKPATDPTTGATQTLADTK